MAGTQDKQENIPKRPNIRQKTYLKGQTEYKNIPKRPNRLQKTNLKCQKEDRKHPKKAKRRRNKKLKDKQRRNHMKFERQKGHGWKRQRITYCSRNVFIAVGPFKNGRNPTDNKLLKG